MATNEERREAASLLRERAGYEMGCVFKELYGDCNSAGPTCGECNERAMRYVADLIEPTRNCSEPTRTYGKCDLDALLALADVLSLSAKTGMCAVHSSCLCCPGDDDPDDMLGCYREIANTVARRIRKALGVEL